jgi:hypothetical protein
MTREGLEHLLSKPDSKAGRLQRACLRLIAEHQRDGAIPTSIRFMFYELVSRSVVPKQYLDEDGKLKGRQPSNDISDAMTHLRERGIVPWAWIVDETRSLASWGYGEIPAEEPLSPERAKVGEAYAANFGEFIFHEVRE